MRWSTRAAALAFGLAGGVAAAQNYAFPRIASAAQVDASCQRLLADSRAQEVRLQGQTRTEGAMLGHPHPGPLPRAREGDLPRAGEGDKAAAPTVGEGEKPASSLLVELDALNQRYEDTLGPLTLLAAVHPAKPIRDAAEACERKYQAFNTAFQQNPRIHALLKQARPADAIDRRLLQDTLDAFEDAGVNLAPAEQARAKAINAETTRLAQAFERRIREDRTEVAFTAAELQGVPPKVWLKSHRDAQGRYLLRLDAPTSDPVIEQALAASTRERMWRATMAVGGDANLRILAQLGALRREYAHLFGFDSYADFALRRRMAQSEAQVQAFLGQVQDVVRQREVADLAVLRAAEADDVKQPLAATALHRWDLRFYLERARRAKYDVDQEAFRAYFPPEASLQFVFKVAERLFGVQFAPLKASLWHADARAFNVTDSSDGQTLGTLFVDLYPRADKYNHAAVWSFRNVSTLSKRLPAAALVVNFNRQGLTIDELETLLHEFGHALHSLLSTTRYSLQGGTNVLLDFVEAPSQMLEDWVYDPTVLALFQEVCAACQPVPAELIARADRARRFGQGIEVARQHLYASYDLAVYGKEAAAPLDLWRRMEGATPLGYEAGSLFPARFSHIADGYQAGYYAYLWSEVVADDLRTGFAGHRLDPAVGQRYRAAVLSRGGEVAPAEMVQQFLGRPTDSRAFFKELNTQ